MRIIRPDAFATQQWKNGGGVTHEIARAEDESGLIWRLSMAEVASDGPFSAFPGLERILTVIDGAGLILETDGGPIAARPLDPVRFSGDLTIHGRLIGGKVRDLNLIYDPKRIDGAVRLVDGTHPLHDGPVAALYCLSGRFRLSGEEIGSGCVAILDPAATAPKADPGATGLYISLQEVSV
ncbi:MAG: HutD family protein [Albidovulum sp.]|uniref:HutD/Ves family protein n=1 Tax=Albidovulum sp. TaxID=1872424 RepID=UPI003C96EFF7